MDIRELDALVSGPPYKIEMTSDEIKKLIRDIPDFPKPGILFRDITPLIGDARGLAAIVDQVAEPWLGKVDMVLGIESRGFIFGAPVAYRLGVGLTIVRKPGKLPFRVVDESYDLEYGSATLEMHQDSLGGKSRVLVVDDLLATGGTALAAMRLAHKVGSKVVGCAFVIELNALKGRERLAPVPCLSLVQYD
jgi:adenine phosphoribosyltransferase